MASHFSTHDNSAPRTSNGSVSADSKPAYEFSSQTTEEKKPKQTLWHQLLN